jgi:hypothetical protein
MMRRLICAFLVFFSTVPVSFGAGAVSCSTAINNIHCFTSTDFPTLEEAQFAAAMSCERSFGNSCDRHGPTFTNTCFAIFITPTKAHFGSGATREAAEQSGLFTCRTNDVSPNACDHQQTRCDQTQTSPRPQAQPERPFDYLSDPAFYRALAFGKLLEDIRTGIGLGLGVLIVIIAFAKRALLINFVIHGNLPYTIKNPSEDIVVLFTRSQRVNWQGRVIFGLTAQMGMTETQLSLIRKYWLGRVIAFDSLRRQKQNELARLHLQQVANIDSKPKNEKPLSLFLAFFRTLFLVVFWVLRALFSFVFGFLFIRMTIAKLVRGSIVESVDLTLLMEAKDAIEETTIYLKEYLLLAETFDGREEVYEPTA